MRKQMWKKRVCFVLAMILAALAVTPVEMDHADAAMVHSVTALMTGNLVNKSNADKLTYRQLETSAYERKLISKGVQLYHAAGSRTERGVEPYQCAGDEGQGKYQLCQ